MGDVRDRIVRLGHRHCIICNYFDLFDVPKKRLVSWYESHDLGNQLSYPQACMHFLNNALLLRLKKTPFRRHQGQGSLGAVCQSEYLIFICNTFTSPACSAAEKSTYLSKLMTRGSTRSTQPFLAGKAVDGHGLWSQAQLHQSVFGRDACLVQTKFCTYRDD